MRQDYSHFTGNKTKAWEVTSPAQGDWLMTGLGCRPTAFVLFVYCKLLQECLSLMHAYLHFNYDSNELIPIISPQK